MVLGPAKPGVPPKLVRVSIHLAQKLSEQEIMFTTNALCVLSASSKGATLFIASSYTINPGHRDVKTCFLSFTPPHANNNF